jgi:hypothetical protein
MNNGFIWPTEPARGKGTKAIFTLKDVYGIALFQKLVQKGFKREATSKFVKEVVALRAIEGFGYIVFEEGEGGLTDPIVLTPEEWILHVNTGKVGNYDPDSKEIRYREARPGVSEDWWDFIHMINLKKLREKVNAQLSVLG